MKKIKMAATLTAVPKNEQLGVIQFLTLENVSGSEIHVRMCMVPQHAHPRVNFTARNIFWPLKLNKTSSLVLGHRCRMFLP